MIGKLELCISIMDFFIEFVMKEGRLAWVGVNMRGSENKNQSGFFFYWLVLAYFPKLGWGRHQLKGIKDSLYYGVYKLLSVNTFRYEKIRLMQFYSLRISFQE
jgi:hypothetical protein